MSAFTRANMATYGQKIKKYKWRADNGRAQIVIERTYINFDKLATAVGTALAVSDTYQIFDIEPNETVLVMGFHIATAATGAADIDIGLTGGDVDGFVDGIEANDTSPTVVAAPFGLISGTKFSSADTIDILEASGGASLAGCKAYFWVIKLRID